MFERPEEKLKGFVVFLFWIVLIGSVIAAIVLSTQSEALIGPAILGCVGLNLINYLSALLIMSYLNLCSNTQAMADKLLGEDKPAQSPSREYNSVQSTADRSHGDSVGNDPSDFPDAIPVSKAGFEKKYSIVCIDDSTIRSKLKVAGISVGATLIVHSFEGGKYAADIDYVTASVSQDAAKHIFIKPIEE